MSVDRGIGTGICFIDHASDSVTKGDGVGLTLAVSAGIGINVEFGAGFSCFDDYSLAVPADVEIVWTTSIVRNSNICTNIGIGCFV